MGVALSPDLASDGTMLVSTYGGGFYVSKDAGTTWVCMSDGYLKSSSVGALAVSDSDPNVIYAGMGESTIRADVSPGDGVYRSTDSGRTWQHVGLADSAHIGEIRVALEVGRQKGIDPCRRS